MEQPYKPKDEDVLAMLSSILDTTGIFSLSNDPDHYLRNNHTGAVLHTVGNEEDQRPLALYYSADANAAIINPLSEGNTTAPTSSAFYSILSLVVSMDIAAVMKRVLTVGASSRRKDADDSKLSAKSKTTKTTSKPTETSTSKSGVRGDTIIATMREDTHLDSLSEADVSQAELDDILELTTGVLTNIDDTTVTEFKKIAGRKNTLFDFLSLHYNAKQGRCDVSSVLTNSNRQKAFPSIRSRSWEVFKTILFRLLKIDPEEKDLSSLSYTPKIPEVAVFEGYVTVYCNMLERLAPHIFVDTLKINLATIGEIRTHLKYLKEYHNLAKWCIGTTGTVQDKSSTVNSALPSINTVSMGAPMVPVTPPQYTQQPMMPQMPQMPVQQQPMYGTPYGQPVQQPQLPPLVQAPCAMQPMTGYYQPVQQPMMPQVPYSPLASGYMPVTSAPMLNNNAPAMVPLDMQYTPSPNDPTYRK